MWGSITSSMSVMRGWRIVSTAGHGGHMMTYNFAEKHLPEKFLNLMPKHNGYYCFEEDSLFAVPLCLNETLKRSFWEFIKSRGSDKTFEYLSEGLLDNASQYHADILRMFNIQPSESAKVFDTHQEADLLRSTKSPDIAVCAWGPWGIITPKNTLVETGAGTFVLCTSESYSLARKKAQEEGSAREMLYVDVVPFESLEPLSVRTTEYVKEKFERHEGRTSNGEVIDKYNLEYLLFFIKLSLESDLKRAIEFNNLSEPTIHGKLNCDLTENDIETFIQKLAMDIHQSK